MSQDIVYLTKEGLEKLKTDLRRMRVVERPRISAEIAEARAQGDLSENAEYDAAKESQGHLEARIAQAEVTVMNARLIDESKIDSSKAFIMSTVKVLNKKAGREMSFTLVSAEEADMASGKISIGSPIGKGLLGSSIGDVVEVNVPAGAIQFEVLDISR